MRFIDLFSGIGGFRIALEKQGGTCVFSSDIDPFARETYKQNFGEYPAGDIQRIEAKDIPKHDVLCGGFPCQPFSEAGKRETFNDPRGQLIYDIIRIAEHHKPDILFLENVKNIILMQKKRTIQKICQLLDEAGYDVHYNKLNAGLYGCGQARERVYFVCTRKGSGIQYTLPKPTYEPVYVQDFLDHDAVIKNPKLIVPSKRQGTFILQHLKPDNPQLKLLQAGYLRKNMQGARVYYTNGLAATVTVSNSGLYMTEDELARKPSKEEVLRIMGYDDTYYIHGIYTQFRKQLGNSVIPKMIELIYKGIS